MKDELFKKLMEITHPAETETETETETFEVSGFGCHNGEVVTLVKDIFKTMKKDVKVVSNEKSSKEMFPIGTVVVPLDNRNGHNYEIGEPCVVFNDSNRAISVDGKHGNHLPGANNTDSIRKATEEEIKHFVNNFKGVLFIQ